MLNVRINSYFFMGSAALLGASWTLPDTFWNILEISKMLEKLLLRTYFELLDRSRMIPTKFKKMSKNIENLGKSSNNHDFSWIMMINHDWWWLTSIKIIYYENIINIFKYLFIIYSYLFCIYLFVYLCVYLFIYLFS